MTALVPSYKTLSNSQPGTGVAALCSPAGGTEIVISSIIMQNNDVVARTVTLYKNGTATANIILGPVTLQAGDNLSYKVPITLNGTAGDTLQAKASAATAITVDVNGALLQ